MVESLSVTHKLGSYEGVFIPTTLNVLSILIYLRFGFILGQAGVLGSLVLLLISYVINLLTTLSVSAIATNGVVKGGGAYFMISRSLGPEFGGSIGVVFYIGQVLNAGLNVAGFTDPLLAKFGRSEGSVSRSLPDSPNWAFLYETMLLLICTTICLLGPQLFARSSKLLFCILLVATLAIPVSTFFVKSFFDSEFNAWYTGLMWATFGENFWPQFTKGAAGSDLDTVENWGNMFAIFFSATAGILAGASMSGDLKNPSKSIPKGTLWGLVVTFLLYFSVIIAVGASTSRDLLHRDIDVISTIDMCPALVMLGEFATSIFSALMGVLGAAKLLQAIARDNVVPGLSCFGTGTGADDNPIRAILLTYVLTQLTILLDVNQIAVYITMAFLMTFVVLNLACFLLEVASAPNFRPSFRYFDARTAMLGFITCIGAMLAADMIAALAILLLGILIFAVIHTYSAPKPWGDVSQAIIYHQVRKYLLKLKQDHVKYWRPQILLFVDDPRSCWQLIRFCNYLKKGGLFILGHVVVVGSETEFHSAAHEVNHQRSAWEKLRNLHHIKAFFQISTSVSIVWGVRNVFLGSGMGGMKPNISVLGFYDENELGQRRREFVDVDELPTDSLRKERPITLSQWVQIIEDLLVLGSNVCVVKGFMELELPAPKPMFKWSWSFEKSYKHAADENEKGCIDLYPIQMSARLMDVEGNTNGLSINLDTYMLILQLGSILHSVKAWSASHYLRVIAFVEQYDEIGRETDRITELLDTLRIDAEVRVYSLDQDNEVYNVIIIGAEDKTNYVAMKLQNSRWYSKVLAARRDSTLNAIPVMDVPKSRKANTYVVPKIGLKKRRTLSSLQQLGVSHSIQATEWLPKQLDKFHQANDTSDSDSESDSEGDSVAVATPNASPQKSSNGSTAAAVAGSSILVGSNRTSSVGSFGRDDVGPSFQDDAMDASELSNDGEAKPELWNSRIKLDQQSALKGMQFNDLPASSQHLILNCLMRKISKDASVIFSTLPAPALGTYKDEGQCKKYHELLQLLCDDLPPIALVNAQSMTVTTAL